jgi:hypothetical protein
MRMSLLRVPPVALLSFDYLHRVLSRGLETSPCADY